MRRFQRNARIAATLVKGLPFDPASLFAGTEGGFWDFTDSATVFSDSARTTSSTIGGAIKGVTDKSGNGRHLQTAASTILRQNGGGHDYASFPGGSIAALNTPNFTAGALGGYTCVIGVRNTGSTANQNYALVDSDISTGANRLAQVLFFWGGGGYETTTSWNSDGTLNGTTQTATPHLPPSGDHVVTVQRTPTLESIRVDGTQTISQVMTKNARVSAANSGAVAIGGAWWGTSTPINGVFIGRIYAALMIYRALTAGELANLEAWMTTRSN
jgi:hypothetical protein